MDNGLQHGGDLSQLGLHTGIGDNHHAPTKRHGSSHVDHVAPIGQCRVGWAGDGAVLFRRFGLARQGGLLRAQVRRFAKPAVRWHGTAGLQQHDITGDEFRCRNFQHVISATSLHNRHGHSF